MIGRGSLCAKKPDSSFEDVGDVVGLERLRDLEIQDEIVREGIATGRSIERPSASSVQVRASSP